ncbi:MAG: preprotein translocase subunit SecE [Saprospiraceae bacterium]
MQGSNLCKTVHRPPSTDTVLKMESLKLYVQESYNELMTKVTWPTWPNLQQTTVVVLVGLGIFTLLVFIMDAISKFLLNDIIYPG